MQANIQDPPQQNLNATTSDEPSFYDDVPSFGEPWEEEPSFFQVFSSDDIPLLAA
jgi:hypothetical protein